MTAPQLTLALPTFNRGSSIGQALESLALGLRDCSPGAVELDIRDNASTDETAAVVDQFRKAHPELQIRFDRNADNVGYDRNHLLLWKHARGRHILFCSDRYYYGIDFRPVVAALRELDPAGLVFSDRFRAVWPEHPKGARDAPREEWLVEKLGASQRTCDGWPVLETTVDRVIESGALKLNWIAANVSDLVIRRDDSPATEALLESFLDSYMLVVAALLLPFRDRSAQVAVHQVPWFANAFDKLHFGGQRHDQLKVAYGHLKLAKAFPFVGTPDEISAFQVRVLLQNYLPIASGVADYQHRYTAEEIRRYVTDTGATLTAVQNATLDGLEALQGNTALRVLNAGFQGARLVGREAKRLPRLARALADVARTVR